MLVIKLSNNSAKVTEESDEYNKNLYVSATLPDIQGNNNITKDEFGKKINVSENVSEPKKWKNLDFDNFNVYSYNSLTSVISFDIVNNTNMILETSDYQLQLKDDSGNVVSIINFDSVTLPCGGTINVTVDITGDVTNVKDILVDEINYTMELQEVK